MTNPLRLLVISDTHIPDFAKALPAAILDEAKRSDLILHAGDVTSASVLEELSAVNDELIVAAGNNDGRDVRVWGAHDEIELQIEGVGIGLLHDSGPSKGREGRMRRRFPDADVVVFGHSHIPIDTEVDGLRLFNPGSPTWKRRQPQPTYGVLQITDGKIRSRIVPMSVPPI